MAMRILPALHDRIHLMALIRCLNVAQEPCPKDPETAHCKVQSTMVHPFQIFCCFLACPLGINYLIA